jgi:outer membrane murein-binding lipoprotein Lpp
MRFYGGKSMKKILVLAVIAVIFLAGCASGKFLGFLATTDYVDSKSRDQAAALKDQAAQIESLKAQLADYQSLKTQAQAAIDQMNQSQKTIQDLQALAQRAEARIGSIPKEVIRQIVDILQASLTP